ncbi:MAG: site-2 protease family protein [Pseudomonadota bacterium]
MESLIQNILIGALPILLAITLHEAAHGYTARHFGDPTAWQAGRISLNPMRHISLVGTVLVPLSILLLSEGDFLFGWAKPVPVDFGRLRQPKKDMLWVAAAGPAANLLMVFGWALLLKLDLILPFNPFSLALAKMALIGININLALMLLNLLPLPPLDGGRIVLSLLPTRMALSYAQLERFGLPILLVLLFTGILGALLTPLTSLLRDLLQLIFQLPLA